MSEFRYEYVTDDNKLPRIAHEISETPHLGFDIETAAVDPWKTRIEKAAVDPYMGYIRLMQFNTGKNIYVVDLLKCKNVQPLIQALKDYNGIVIGHNLKFENKWLKKHFGFYLKKTFDTWRAYNIIHNGKPECKQSGLWDVEQRYLGITHTQGEDSQKDDWSVPELTERQKDYAAGDVRYLHPLREKMIAEILQWALVKTAKIEFDVIPAEAEVELNGYRMERGLWLKLADANEAKAKELSRELQKELPNPSNQLGLFGHMDWNLDSQQEMLQSLRKLGIKQKLKDPESRKTFVVPLQDTQEMTLAMFGDQYPVIKKILEYRGYSNRLKTFGPEFVNFIHPITGRIHTSYWPFTGAGRYSSQRPNLQQIPRDQAFRACFNTTEGRILVVCDYSAVELVIMAELSKDPALCAVFNEGKDPHLETASILNNIPVDQITKAQRQQAKPVNFGFCLLAGSKVMTSKGLVSIENVSVGDTVLTHKNRWRPVTDTQKIKADKALAITFKSNRVLRCTPDHGVLTFDIKRPEPYEWIRAGDLKEGDTLCYHGSDAYEGVHSMGVPAARMLGWFLSEGSCTSRNGLWISQDSVKNKVVTESMRLTLSKLGFRERADGTMARFRLPKALHAPLFEKLDINLEARSACKRLPPQSFDLIREERYALLGALWDGDGTVTQAKETSININYYSNSIGLLNDVRDLLDSVGINAKVYAPPKGRTVGCVGILGSDGRHAFLNRVPTTKVNNVTYDSKHRGGETAIIRSITETDHGDFVYDITVDEDHSFVADSHIVMNCYGMQSAKLVLYAKAGYGVDLTEQQSRVFRDKYFQNYKGIAAWHAQQLSQGQRTKMAHSINGRHRFMRDDDYNAFLNSPDQGTGADALKTALAYVRARLEREAPNARMVHHVHDEIIVETDADEHSIAICEKILEEEMLRAINSMLTVVQAKAEPGHGPSWAEAK